MRHNHTASPGRLELSRAGVLFVSGFATSLRVERGHLLVRSGAGRSIREARIAKIGRPRLRRLVVFGRGGYATFEALAWLDRTGASFMHLDRSGRVVAMSGQPGPDSPTLRRMQVSAFDTEVGLSIVKRLLGAKLSGQRSVIEGHGSGSVEDRLADARAALDTCSDTRQALAIEARAASAYWSALADLPVRFAKVDIGQIPEHWSRVGERHSILSSKPRQSVAPAHTMINFLYHLATAEASLALLALGLDPGLGWAHRDAPYRDSAALDLVEAVRPDIDDYVLDLLGERTFSRREFGELPTGQVRLAPLLAKLLAESTLGRWEETLTPHAEEIARTLAGAAGVRAPSATARGAGSKGRGALARGSTTEAARTKRVPNACRMCGVILSIDERGHVRKICNECLPAFEADRTEKLVRAAKQALAKMRSSDEDPAQTPEAKAKRSAAISERARLAREWKRENPGSYDREEFVREVLPGLARVTLPAMVNATGLTSGYCFQIKRGERTPHPMYWAVLRELTNG
jgi:CRISPR-associated endonuclease Cas1